MWTGIWRASCFCVLSLGCASLETVSSGQIGCKEEDIEISDDSMGFSSRTWTAVCRGRVYYCTAVQTGKESGQVNCTEDNQSASVAAKPPAPAPKPAAPRPAPKVALQTPPPTGAAGLTFGSDAAAAEAACLSAGQKWSAAGTDHFACSAPPKPLGVDAEAYSRFCNGKLCAIKLNINAQGKWMSTYSRLAAKLDEKYGVPQSRQGTPPIQCVNSLNDDVCMKGRPNLNQTWRWANGTRIQIELSTQKDLPELSVVYVQQPDEVVGDAL